MHIIQELVSKQGNAGLCSCSYQLFIHNKEVHDLYNKTAHK